MMRPRRIKLAATSGVGAMIRVTILYPSLAKDKRRRSQFTYCSMNGLSRNGFWLDHNRPLQPVTSSKPQKIAVGKIHQRRKWNA